MANPYELWNTRKSLGVMQKVKKEYWYFEPYAVAQINATEEYVDLEKLVEGKRKLAPFALPMARGGSVFENAHRLFRLKPAYVKLEDVVDPDMLLTMQPGIDVPFLDGNKLSPMQRLELIKMQMTAQHLSAIRRRWEWLRAKSIIDGQVTLQGKEYPTTVVNFLRNANQTIVLGAGSRFGEPGVSIIDFFQLVVDRMTSAEGGAVPLKVAMGGAVWQVMRKDTEVLSHMDKNVAGGTITIDRGVTAGADGEKCYKVGEVMIGGASGQKIELWVNNEDYFDPITKTTQRYLGDKEMIFTASPSAIGGTMCFGMIKDRKADFQALPIFPNNWMEGNNPQVEWLGHTSAPIFVPIYANATCKATVLG